MMVADKARPRRTSERKAGLPASERRGGMAGMFSRRAFRLLLMCAFLLSAGAGRMAADLAADLARISVEAAGGAKAHAALRSFRAVGVTKVGDQELSFILHAERPNRLRIETLGDAGTLVRGFDGVHAPWRRSGLFDAPQRLAAGEERGFARDAEFEQPLHDWERRGLSLDYAGEANLEGRTCRKLLVVARDSRMTTLYLDDETRLVVRRDETRRLKGGREIVIETHYGDYQETAGVLLPRRLRVVVDGKTANETRIETINANPDLPAGFFAPPAPDWPKW